MRHRLGSTAVLAAVLLISAPAGAQDTGTAIAELSQGSLFVESGAEEVDESAMRSAIATAADAGIDLRVGVFSTGNAEGLSQDIAEALGSVTVLTFTPSSFGVFSNEISQSRLDEALAEAADDLSGPDAATGARAFADALDREEDSDGLSTGLVIAGIVGLLVVVGVGGRIWEVRTRDARHARRRQRRQAEMQERTKALGGRIVDMSDAVDLAENPEFNAKFATATGLFDESEAAIAAAPDMHQLDAVAERLKEAESLLDEVAAGLASG